MKKLLPLLILFVYFLGLSIYFSWDNGQTTMELSSSWTLTNKKIENIEIYGSEQPVEVEIVEAGQDMTTVQLFGQVAESTLATLEQARTSDSSLYLPLSEKGFKLLTVADGKSVLKARIELARGASFKQLYIDTWNGTVTISVPKNYNGQYDVKLNSGAQLLESLPSENNDNSVIKIDAYADVRIRTSE